MIRPEDESKINEMTIALRLSKEAACILLVSFNDELLRRDVETEIKRRLEPEGYNFREYRVTEDKYRNLPIMLVDMDPQPEDIFLILDLKKALPEVLEYLNYRREDFVEHDISAIFWLDEPTLTEIARKALDFWAFRSLPVFEFNVDRSRDMTIPGRTTPSEIFIYSSLEELEDKIALREELLEDYLENRPQDRSTIAGLHNELGILYQNKSQFDEAMGHYREALGLYSAIKDRQGEANALGNMGIVYWYKGDLDKALEHHSQTLDIHRRIGDIQGEAKDLDNIGIMYWTKGDLGKALECLSQALDIAHRIGDVRAEANVLRDMGLVHHDKGNLGKAVEYCSQALHIYCRIGDVQGKAIQLNNMGIVCQDKGDLDKAVEYYSHALEIDRRIGNIQEEANALNNMGTVYRAEGDLRAALDCIGKALRIYISTGTAMFARISYGNLREIIEQMKVTGMELSEEDKDEIAELTEEYEKLKGETAGATTS